MFALKAAVGEMHTFQIHQIIPLHVIWHDSHDDVMFLTRLSNKGTHFIFILCKRHCVSTQLSLMVRPRFFVSMKTIDVNMCTDLFSHAFNTTMQVTHIGDPATPVKTKFEITIITF